MDSTTLIIAAGKQQGAEFGTHCIGLIRKALVDETPEVREAAAQAFDSLHQNLGTKAIDEVLPSLLNELKVCAKPCSIEAAPVL